MILQSDAKKLLDQEENYPKVKQSLMEKYRIPVQHFEYSYIETCQDGKELERIVEVLRSGEEGHFPDLTSFAENRLTVIKPKSKLLRKPCQVVRKEELDTDEKKNINQDLTQWISDVTKDDDELVLFKNRKSNNRPFPEVRQATEQIVEDKKKETPKRISATDYSSWEKYDPDTEILKMDLEEENLKKAVLEKEKKKPTTKKTVQFKDFTTDVEALREANYEKEKGNEFFKTGDYKEALRHYTNSINCKPTVAGLNNRALTHIKLKNFKNATDDCNSVLSLESDNIKAFLRKAQALDGLGKHTEALESVQRAIEVDPNNTLAQELADKFQKLCGVVPQKVRRFFIQDSGKEETNQKKLIQTNNAKKTPKKEVVIPIPGTSNMSPPHYITCRNSDEKQIKEQTLRIHNSGHMIRLVSIDSSDIDDDDCCAVNHLEKICSNLKLSEIIDSPETTKLPLVDSKNERRGSSDKSPHISKKTKCKKGKKGKQSQEQSGSKTNRQTNHVLENRSSCRSLVAEDNNLINKEDFQVDINVEPTQHDVIRTEEKTARQQPIKTDTNAGGEPYIEHETFNVPEDIHSPYNFLKIWNSANVDKTLEQHAAVLRSIDMNRISEVIGCKLDNAMFTTTIKCLCVHFAVPGEVERLYVTLTNIVNLPRFGIISMLMSAEDQNCVNTLVNFLNQHGRPLCQETLNKFFNN